MNKRIKMKKLKKELISDFKKIHELEVEVCKQDDLIPEPTVKGLKHLAESRGHVLPALEITIEPSVDENGLLYVPEGEMEKAHQKIISHFQKNMFNDFSQSKAYFGL